MLQLVQHQNATGFSTICVTCSIGMVNFVTIFRDYSFSLVININNISLFMTTAKKFQSMGKEDFSKTFPFQNLQNNILELCNNLISK